VSKLFRIILIALLVAPSMVGCVVDTDESTGADFGHDYAALDADGLEAIDDDDALPSPANEIYPNGWQNGQIPLAVAIDGTPAEGEEREESEEGAEPVPDPWKGSSTVGGGTGSDD